MTIPLRQRLFIIIGGAIVVVVIITLALMFVLRQKKNVTVDNTSTSTPSDQNQVIDSNNFDLNSINPIPVTNTIPAGLPIKPATTLETRQNQVRQLAKIFMERYGTFSTDSNFENIREVQPLVNADLWKKISGPLTSTAKPTSFSSATTQVIGTEITNWSETSAEVAIRAVKNENKAGVVKDSQLLGTVTLLKQGDNWLVSKFTWNP